MPVSERTTVPFFSIRPNPLFAMFRMTVSPILLWASSEVLSAASFVGTLFGEKWISEVVTANVGTSTIAVGGCVLSGDPGSTVTFEALSTRGLAGWATVAPRTEATTVKGNSGEGARAAKRSSKITPKHTASAVRHAVIPPWTIVFNL